MNSRVSGKPVTKPATKRIAWLVFTLWLVISSVLLWTWAFADYGYFDEHNDWIGFEPPTILTTEQLDTEQLDTEGEAQWLMVHVRTHGCRCNAMADAHKPAFEKKFAGQLRHVNRSPAQLQQLGISVPATPMVVLLKYEPDEGWKLGYAGPYASGPLCAVENSFLPALLSGTVRPAGVWLNGNTKACRCLLYDKV